MRSPRLSGRPFPAPQRRGSLATFNSGALHRDRQLLLLAPPPPPPPPLAPRVPPAQAHPTRQHSRFLPMEPAVERAGKRVSAPSLAIAARPMAGAVQPTLTAGL